MNLEEIIQNNAPVHCDKAMKLPWQPETIFANFKSSSLNQILDQEKLWKNQQLLLFKLLLCQESEKKEIILHVDWIFFYQINQKQALSNVRPTPF